MGKCNESQVDSSIEVIQFLLDTDNSNEKYAIEISYVDEIYSAKGITQLPCTPYFIIGIMNFRGKIISIIDIRIFLGFSSKAINFKNVKNVIVVKVNEMEIGIAADHILGCSKIPLSEIQKEVLTITNAKKEHFKGVTKERSIILHIKNIMLDENIIVNEEVI